MHIRHARFTTLCLVAEEAAMAASGNTLQPIDKTYRIRKPRCLEAVSSARCCRVSCVGVKPDTLLRLIDNKHGMVHGTAASLPGSIRVVRARCHGPLNLCISVSLVHNRCGTSVLSRFAAYLQCTLLSVEVPFPGLGFRVSGHDSQNEWVPLLRLDCELFRSRTDAQYANAAANPQSSSNVDLL